MNRNSYLLSKLNRQRNEEKKTNKGEIHQKSNFHLHNIECRKHYNKLSWPDIMTKYFKCKLKQKSKENDKTVAYWNRISFECINGSNFFFFRTCCCHIHKFRVYFSSNSVAIPAATVLTNLLIISYHSQ